MKDGEEGSQTVGVALSYKHTKKTLGDARMKRTGRSRKGLTNYEARHYLNGLKDSRRPMKWEGPLFEGP
jgi:hypothetical protein